jgi:hypothetical protein
LRILTANLERDGLAKDLIAHEPMPAEIMVAIVGGQPIPAAMLGNLIIALSRDYKALNRGRTLVVSRLETGSLLVFVQDAYYAVQPYLADGVSLSKGGGGGHLGFRQVSEGESR